MIFRERPPQQPTEPMSPVAAAGIAVLLVAAVGGPYVWLQSRDQMAFYAAINQGRMVSEKKVLQTPDMLDTMRLCAGELSKQADTLAKHPDDFLPSAQDYRTAANLAMLHEVKCTAETTEISITLPNSYDNTVLKNSDLLPAYYQYAQQSAE